MLLQILTQQNYTFKEAVITFLIIMVVVFVSLSAHEFAHAFMAHKMGDDTAKIHGRLTLNPFAHLDPMGLICFLVVGIGWARPVPINPLNFKKYRRGIRLVSIAGVVMNFILGLLATAILIICIKCGLLAYAWFEYIWVLLSYFMIVNGLLVMFNIIPIFPLDGFNFLTSFFRTENAYVRFNLRNGRTLLLSILIVSTMIEYVTNREILSVYLNVIYNHIYLPILYLGVI